MTFFAQNAVWIGLALGSGAVLLWPLLRGGAGGQVSPPEAVLAINRDNAVVLDVREETEFAAGHIAGARHIPLAQLPARLKELAKLKQKPLIVNCQGGVRSAKACQILRKEGFTQVSNLAGGLNAWNKAKLPVVKG